MPGRSAKGYVPEGKLCGLYLFGSKSTGLVKIGYSSDVVGRLACIKKELRHGSRMNYMALSAKALKAVAKDLSLLSFRKTDSLSPMEEESQAIKALSASFPSCGRSKEWFFVDDVERAKSTAGV
jgi:hypothetical protein